MAPSAPRLLHPARPACHSAHLLRPGLGRGDVGGVLEPAGVHHRILEVLLGRAGASGGEPGGEGRRALPGRSRRRRRSDRAQGPLALPAGLPALFLTLPSSLHVTIPGIPSRIHHSNHSRPPAECRRAAGSLTRSRHSAVPGFSATPSCSGGGIQAAAAPCLPPASCCWPPCGCDCCCCSSAAGCCCSSCSCRSCPSSSCCPRRRATARFVLCAPPPAAAAAASRAAWLLARCSSLALSAAVWSAWMIMSARAWWPWSAGGKARGGGVQLGASSTAGVDALCCAGPACWVSRGGRESGHCKARKAAHEEGGWRALRCAALRCAALRCAALHCASRPCCLCHAVPCCTALRRAALCSLEGWHGST